MSSRCSIAALLTLPVSAVVCGAGFAAVLGTPHLSIHAASLIPIVIAAAFVVSPMLAWHLAPRLSSTHRRQAETKRRLLEERARREAAMQHRHFTRQPVPVLVRTGRQLLPRPGAR